MQTTGVADGSHDFTFFIPGNNNHYKFLFVLQRNAKVLTYMFQIVPAPAARAVSTTSSQYPAATETQMTL